MATSKRVLTQAPVAEGVSVPFEQKVRSSAVNCCC